MGAVGGGRRGLARGALEGPPHKHVGMRLHISKHHASKRSTRRTCSPRTHPCRSAAGSASCGCPRCSPSWCACRLRGDVCGRAWAGGRGRAAAWESACPGCFTVRRCMPSTHPLSKPMAHALLVQQPPSKRHSQPLFHYQGQPAGSHPPMASISSMKMMQGALRLAAANRERTRREPTPTNISSNSEPALRRMVGVGGQPGGSGRSCGGAGGGWGEVLQEGGCQRAALLPPKC